MKTTEIMAAETGSGEEEEEEEEEDGAGSRVGVVEAVEVVVEEEGSRKGAKGGMEGTAVAQ
jgi:hypothetical protein